MNETNWTPGPWRAEKRLITEITIRAADNTVIAGARCDSYLPGYESDANARLIAKAPEMVEALKLAVRVMQDNNIDEAMAGEFEMFTDLLHELESGGAK